MLHSQDIGSQARSRQDERDGLRQQYNVAVEKQEMKEARSDIIYNMGLSERSSWRAPKGGTPLPVSVHEKIEGISARACRKI
jgi:hypothetical protein